MSVEPGALYVVATPIGHLEDISARALRVLREVHGIAAEDTRHTGQLLRHFGITTPLVSLHDHNERARVDEIVAHLRAQEAWALVSDAGTPLISDPGFPLVRALRALGLPVIPIPGPSSIIAALSVAGLPTDRFIFEGFLPAKTTARCERLRFLATEARTMVFLEASHRIKESVHDLSSVFGTTRPAVIARELTKHFETVHGAPLGTLETWLDQDANQCRINDPKTVNAFCMAGGKMALYTGLLEQVKPTDDEIAQVMGHEISHALANHTRERMSVAMASTVAVTAAAVAMSGRDGAALGLAGAELAAVYAIQLPNSRESESEADRIGIEIAARAGYDPHAAVTLWEKMEKAGGKGPPQFLSTHPSPANRRQTLLELGPKMQPYYEQAKANPAKEAPNFLH